MQWATGDSARPSRGIAYRVRMSRGSMDLNYSAEELAFRDEASAWLARQPARRAARQGDALRPLVEGRSAALAQDPRRQGLDRAGVAAGMGRHRLERRAALHLRGGVRLRRRAAARPLRPDDVRAGAAEVRHRGAEAALPAAHLPRRGFLVPGLFRTGLRLRPRIAAARARCERAITTSSTARRPGPRSRTWPTGSSAWCAPIRDSSASRTAFRSCSST